MIEIITPGHHQFHAPLIESMFRMRYRALIERCGWRVPGLTGERDCDPYDTEDTIYFVDHAPDTLDVVACARLNPTVKPHMLSDLFARYCDLQGVPTGETIYEASRIAIDAGRLDRGERMETISRLERASTAFALQNGIKKVTSFISEKVYVHNIQLWSTRPLGLPAHFEDDDRTYIPAISAMDAAALQRIDERCRMVGAVAGAYEPGGAGEIRSYAPAASGDKPRSSATMVSLSAAPTARNAGSRREHVNGAVIEGARRIVTSLCNRRGSRMRAIRKGNQP